MHQNPVIMKVKFPSDYQQVMPYLILKDPLGFMRFVQEVFGAKEKMKMEDPERGIVHAEVQIGDAVIMFAGATEQWKVCTAGLYVYVADADATYGAALRAGAESLMEPADQSYGRSGGVRDPYGNTWWLVTAPAA